MNKDQPGHADGIRPIHIRSFVLRQGRVSNAQQRHHEEGMPLWGVAYRPMLLDFAATFGRPDSVAPKILEIGFGMGETTANIAAAHPHNDYLGIEVHTPGVGSLLKEITERQLTNLRIIQHDAVEVLRDMIPLSSLDGVHIFFPDPWPKKRQQKRRLIQSPLVSLLTQRLKPGGYLHCATDWEEYAQQMVAVLSAEPLLKNTAEGVEGAEGFAPRPAYRPQTKFETRGLRLGHGVWDVLFRRQS
ncbi:MAG TPA: tRNA (guanosine(46)-N7)-methyltransferase TrmB [Rhodocyclaceae bacterium]|nr:tRNA (guanosine(46)-N7)-methyltransferase TrmB [Rhodocyclaceae bacterium]